MGFLGNSPEDKGREPLLHSLHTAFLLPRTRMEWAELLTATLAHEATLEAKKKVIKMADQRTKRSFVPW
ncbi:hypothetical protein ACRRTK_014884 [Alexandromys fortis]